MADRDGDGFINVSEFCSAVSSIRQAKLQQQQTTSLQRPSRAVGTGVSETRESRGLIYTTEHTKS